MSKLDYDHIVVGAGISGSCAAYQLAKRGKSVLLLEKVKRAQKKNKKNKLGLSWAKLSYQLGFGCTVINICSLILIDMK